MKLGWDAVQSTEEDYKIRRDILEALHTSPYLERNNRNLDRVKLVYIFLTYLRTWMIRLEERFGRYIRDLCGLAHMEIFTSATLD